jgi:hypothetical protein
MRGLLPCSSRYLKHNRRLLGWQGLDLCYRFGMKSARLTIRTKKIRGQKLANGAKLAAALRKWQKSMSLRDHLEIARHIEDYRRRINNEHLH